jgi:hypothetical protein
MWPHVVNAAKWQIARTVEGKGYPHHLQNTYDYLGLDSYPNAAYSGFTHMAAMRAAAAMAGPANDTTGIAAAAQASEALCLATMNTTLWTGKLWFVLPDHRWGEGVGVGMGLGGVCRVG